MCGERELRYGRASADDKLSGLRWKKACGTLTLTPHASHLSLPLTPRSGTSHSVLTLHSLSHSHSHLAPDPSTSPSSLPLALTITITFTLIIVLSPPLRLVSPAISPCPFPLQAVFGKAAELQTLPCVAVNGDGRVLTGSRRGDLYVWQVGREGRKGDVGRVREERVSMEV